MSTSPSWMSCSADDVAQKRWSRCQQRGRSVARDSTAFRSTTTTRLALTVGRPARPRHGTARRTLSPTEQAGCALREAFKDLLRAFGAAAHEGNLARLKRTLDDDLERAQRVCLAV